MSYKDGVHRLTQFGRICLLIVVATLVAGPHNPARAEFKSVNECQRSGDSNSEPGLLARIQCYNDVMSAISFRREKAQHLSDMISAIRGTLTGSSSKSCVPKPYNEIVAVATGGHCSNEWNRYRNYLVDLESHVCRNPLLSLSEEAKSLMPMADKAKGDYDACFEAALLDGRINPEQIQLYQIRSRDHFKEVYGQVAQDWKKNASTYTALFHEHSSACEADGKFLQQSFPAPNRRIVCGSE